MQPEFGKLERVTRFDKMISSIPRHFALKSVSNNSYLQYVNEENEVRGFLQYSGDQALTPYTKFEIEKSNVGRRFVHIKCCYNNKYWVLHSPSSHYIVATAKERDEDRSKPSCTLFKLNPDDDDGDSNEIKTIRFRHVHLNHNLRLKPFGEHQGCVFVGAEESNTGSDLSTVVNWDTLFILPKYVAFKSNNNHYLRPVHRPHSNIVEVQFKGSERADPGVRHEVITTPDGHVRIKNVPYGKFLIPDTRHKHRIILDNKSSDEHVDSKSLFWPIKLGDNTVALRNMDNNCFLRRMSNDINRVIADFDYITDEAKMEVVELVLSREIYNVHFHLSDARVYNEQPVSMTSALVENNNSEDQKLSMKLSYEDTTTSTWSANVNTTFGVKLTIETGVPKVSEVEVEISAEISEGYTWGKTEQFKYLAEYWRHKRAVMFLFLTLNETNS